MGVAPSHDNWVQGGPGLFLPVSLATSSTLDEFTYPVGGAAGAVSAATFPC